RARLHGDSRGAGRGGRARPGARLALARARRVGRGVGEREGVGGANFGPEPPPAVLARKVVEPVPGRDREVVAARRAHARVAHHLLAPEVGLAARAAAVVGLDPAWPLRAVGETPQPVDRHVDRLTGHLRDYAPSWRAVSAAPAASQSSTLRRYDGTTCAS